MAKIEITFARTEYDQGNCWTAIKNVIIEVPDELKEKYDALFEWHVIGGAWVEENDEHPKTTDD